MTPDRTCPACGDVLPPDAPRGLCPACLLRAGLAGDTSGSIDPDVLTGSAAGEVLEGLSPISLPGDEPVGGGPGSHEVTITFGLASPGVLETLAATPGGVPRVRLRDTEPEGFLDSDKGPDLPKLPPLGVGPGRYRLFGEITRGGMGAVLRARDPDLGRDLAVKVLLEKHRDHPDLVRRFVEEAQIGGQLQHPGVVPVYDLGAFADRRPYFAMKLVRGRTLAALLAERAGPADDLPRFLGVFEQICQPVAYAHARGVIHRDLKPANVMVGGFGEVQVMDWGLAKVLPRGGTADGGPSPGAEPEAAIRTARSGSDADASHPGSILGTPAYMAPEQARGEVGRLDERADVFALGAILCEVLTGRPAFTGRDTDEIYRKASLGYLDEALARLDVCGADAELIALAKDCLARAPEGRPREAGAVAGRVTAYLAGVQERLRAAELARVEAMARAEEEAKRRVLSDHLAAEAEAEARAVAERRRRKLQVGLAASVLALTALGGLSGTYVLRQRQVRAAAADRGVGEVATLRDLARARPDDPARWQAALAAVRRAEEAVGAGGGPEASRQLGTLRAEVQAGADAAERDRTLLGLLVDIRSAKADDPDGTATDTAYADAFRAAGLDLDVLDPAEVGARLRRRPAAVAAALVAAIDDWTAVRSGLGRAGSGWPRLVAAARAADPDPNRDQLRAALLIGDAARRLERLRPLTERANDEGWEPASLVLLGNVVADAGDVAAGAAVLGRAAGVHPEDVWVHYDLGLLLERLRPPQAEAAIRAYTAARGVRPETAHALAHALDGRGGGEEAEAIFRDLVRRRPNDARHLGCYGRLLKGRGRGVEATAVLDRAIAASREAIRLKPDDVSAHYNLGLALHVQGEPDEAEAEHREAIRLNPGHAEAHYNLGLALHVQGELDAAIAEFREAIRLNPDGVLAHTSLGNTLRAQGELDEAEAEHREAIRLKPDYADAHTNLGLALYVQGELDEAEAEHREAIRLKPDYADAHTNLGLALYVQGELDEAEAEHREAIRLKPDYADAHTNLGLALRARGELDAAIAEFREALRLNPGHAEAHNGLGALLCDVRHDYGAAEGEFREAIRLKPDLAGARYNLGLALQARGELDAAIAEFREAIRLKPDHAEAHCNLAGLLKWKGYYAWSLAEYRRGHELGSKRPGWRYPSAEWVRQAEQLAARHLREQGP